MKQLFRTKERLCHTSCGYPAMASVRVVPCGGAGPRGDLGALCSVLAADPQGRGQHTPRALPRLRLPRAAELRIWLQMEHLQERMCAAVTLQECLLRHPALVL